MGKRDTSRTGANTEPMPFIRKFGGDIGGSDAFDGGSSVSEWVFSMRVLWILASKLICKKQVRPAYK